jgi:hypothetical protein
MALLAFIISLFNCLVQLTLIVYLVRARVPAALPPAAPTVDEPLPQPFPALLEPNPLEGLRVGICVRQDHEHPTFVAILTEKLRSLDALIRLMTEDEAAALAKDWESIQDSPDVLIHGRLTCNGYSDVFYDSGFECTGRQGRLTTIIEKPAQGGRQFNLADNIIERLRLELTQSRTRDERQRALGELH